MDNKELLLKGATVIDPANGINGKVDVLVKDGVISRVEAEIAPDASLNVLDLTGKYLSPGWIDLHAHVSGDLVGNGVDPDDAGVKTGVTTVVDAGSVGAANVKGYLRYVVSPSVTRVFLFLNGGMFKSAKKGTYADISNVDIEAALKAVEKYPDLIKGIKMLASATQVGSNGITPIKMGRTIARIAGLPLMVHIGNAPPVVEDVLDLLDEGDIVTHAFHGKPGGVLDRNGKPKKEALAARERGVWFDVGHGSASFSYDTMRKAMEAGFGPDSISTDLHVRNIKGPVFDMGTTMSKFLQLGFSLKQVIDLSTRMPARIGGFPLGTLGVGAVADITVFELLDKEVTMKDSDGVPMQVSRVIRPVMTIKGGEKVWTA